MIEFGHIDCIRTEYPNILHLASWEHVFYADLLLQTKRKCVKPRRWPLVTVLAVTFPGLNREKQRIAGMSTWEARGLQSQDGKFWSIFVCPSSRSCAFANSPHQGALQA